MPEVKQVTSSSRVRAPGRWRTACILASVFRTLSSLLRSRAWSPARFLLSRDARGAARPFNWHRIPWVRAAGKSWLQERRHRTGLPRLGVLPAGIHGGFSTETQASRCTRGPAHPGRRQRPGTRDHPPFQSNIGKNSICIPTVWGAHGGGRLNH